jgi:uncharacterized phage protein gp47/JayE
MSSPTFPLATVAATVTAQGITAPTFSDILSSYQASVRSIFGSDIYIDPDSKDGQLLALLAQAQFDSNQAAIAVYNSYNPQTALGVSLDSAVKVNSIRRQVATNSTAVLLIVGQAETEIFRGIASDTLGRLWDLPTQVIIPSNGEILVTATAETQGALQASANTINTAYTQVIGWQSVTNPEAAQPGDPVESDGQLRERQRISTSISASTTASALLSRVSNVPDVRRAQLYVNDTDSTNDLGIPSHSFVMVVQGGDQTAIAQAIEAAKNVGAGTAGDTLVSVNDPQGIPIDIRFTVLKEVPITVNVHIKTLSGFNVSSGATIQQSLADFVNSLGIGEDVFYNWMVSSASLCALTDKTTFVVTSLTQARDSDPLTTNDIPIAYDEAATLDPSNVTVTQDIS